MHSLMSLNCLLLLVRSKIWQVHTAENNQNIDQVDEFLCCTTCWPYMSIHRMNTWSIWYVTSTYITLILNTVVCFSTNFHKKAHWIQHRMNKWLLNKLFFHSIEYNIEWVNHYWINFFSFNSIEYNIKLINHYWINSFFHLIPQIKTWIGNL